MAPRRETNARELARTGAELCAGVEEDVEKKRHVKDPFREPYVALVAAPFDAFLTKHARQHAGNDGDVDMERGDDEQGEVDEAEEHVALQQEISARSQQVHLRLEILRRQMQSLVEESSAILDAGSIGPKKETSKKKKTPALLEPIGDERGDGSIINLERMLERAALYESGELTDCELQKTWRYHQCSCDKHEVIGADAKLENLRSTLEEDFESVREEHLRNLGPRLLVDFKDATTEPSSQDSHLAQFLEDCKRSIKPFFLEDFVQLDADDSQPDRDTQADQDDAHSGSASRSEEACENEPDAQETTMELPDVDMDMCDEILSNSCNMDEEVMEQVTSDIRESRQPSERCSDAASSHANKREAPIFTVASVRACRQALRKKAAKIKADCSRSQSLALLLSRQSFDSVKDLALPKRKPRPSPLVCDVKKWQHLSMSVLDSSINLVELRQTLSVALDEPLDTEELKPLDISTQFSLDPTPPTAISNEIDGSHRIAFQVPTPVPPPSFQTKRQLHIAEAPQQKKARVNETTKPQRSLSLRAMMKSIHDVFHRVAQTSCVSYLSTLIRSDISSSSPQRAFVALVFSASLTNTTQESPDDRDKQLRVTLQSANAGRDVKIICCQE